MSNRSDAWDKVQGTVMGSMHATPPEPIVVGLTSEVVNDSDVCPGCNYVYLTPEGRRDPKTDRWAWRRCPTRTCRLHDEKVSYSGDWEDRARKRVLQLETALRIVLDVASVVDPQHGEGTRRMAGALKELLRYALPDPTSGICPACEATPEGADGRAPFCRAHREGR